MNVKLLLYWLPMIPIAFVNAAIRETLFARYVSETSAQQLSTITLVIFCFIYTWFVFPRLLIQNTSPALVTGIIWAVLTVLFEFSLGLMLKHPLQELLANYNIAEGRLWPLFLICLSLMPYTCLKIKS